MKQGNEIGKRDFPLKKCEMELSRYIVLVGAK